MGEASSDAETLIWGGWNHPHVNQDNAAKDVIEPAERAKTNKKQKADLIAKPNSATCLHSVISQAEDSRLVNEAGAALIYISFPSPPTRTTRRPCLRSQRARSASRSI